jgi:ribonuclease E
MLGKKILIDGLYKEDTTVVLYEAGKIEEVRHQKQYSIKGNIYLAKVEKIAPELQAAFVKYSSGKLGFLEIGEIHPRFYETKVNNTDKDSKEASKVIESDNPQAIKALHKELVGWQPKVPIQHLLKENQTILVQIEKDERGTKGASLTTYLSLSGRFCVVLFNSGKANIVSKLVEDEAERQRLKEIAKELCLVKPDLSIILKPNAAYKTKAEIARDFGYLLRLWEKIEKHAEAEEAPLFIHEEGDVVKQSIRDLYNAEVEEIIVSGESTFANAKAFMQLLMPRYLTKLKKYTGNKPLLQEYGLIDQIYNLYQDSVSLPSGGYLVINQTEALTSIDVNSGRAKGHDSLEQTASKTNLEAAREAVNQIKLRNLSGLIVVDFIDMASAENKAEVEVIVREGLTNQATKSLVSKMSDFALLEISRQRLGNSLYESVFHRCKECNGKGRVRSFDLTSLAILRAIEDEIEKIDLKDREDYVIEVGARKDVILHMINDRKKELYTLEEEVKINLRLDESATLDTFFLEKKGGRRARQQVAALSSIDHTHYQTTNHHHKAPAKIKVEVPLEEKKYNFLQKFLVKIFKL